MTRSPLSTGTEATRLPRMVLAALLVAMLPFAARAQEGVRLSATVTDQEGNPIPGVALTIANPGRGFEVEVVTDEQGRFARGGLESEETYTIRAEVEGYLPYEQAVTTAAEGTATVTIRLEGGRRFAEVRYGEGFNAFQSRDFQAAAASMEQVVAKLAGDEDPGAMYADALAILGYSYGQLDNMVGAERAYNALTEAAPQDSRGFFGLGGIHASRGDVDEAIAAFELAAELNPTDLNIQYALGAIYVEAERFEDAIPPLETFVAVNPNVAVVHLWLGTSYGRTERIDEAIAAYRKYLELEPGAPDRDDVERAIEALEAARRQ